jgi:hypothetical protein
MGMMGLLAAVLLAAAVAGADDKSAKQPQAWKPGPVHQHLASLVGEYTTVSTFHFKPGDPGRETKGSCKLTSILGGRFLMEDNSGSLLGQPTTSMHLSGYNEGSQQYEGTWIYTGSTSMMSLRGTSKDDGKTIEWTGTFTEAPGNEKTLYVTQHFIDADHFTSELYTKNPDGSKGPTLKTSYTRKK